MFFKTYICKKICVKNDVISLRNIYFITMKTLCFFTKITKEYT